LPGRRPRRDRREDLRPRLAGRGAPRPGPRLPRRRRAGARRGPRPRAAPDRHAGTPIHAGGRLPPAHRPDAGGLMATAISTGPTGGPSVQSGRLSPLTGALRQYDYWLTVYKRTWKGSIITSFASPLFYVLAMGVLLGGFVHVSPDQLEGATSYLAFIVPGLIAAQSMQTAVFETTYPVMGALKW